MCHSVQHACTNRRAGVGGIAESVNDGALAGHRGGACSRRGPRGDRRQARGDVHGAGQRRRRHICLSRGRRSAKRRWRRRLVRGGKKTRWIKESDKGSTPSGRHVDSSQSHVNSSLSHSQRLSGVSIDPSLRLTSVSLPSLPAFSSVSSATGSRECPRAPESARECPRVPRLPESTRATS